MSLEKMDQKQMLLMRLAPVNCMFGEYCFKLLEKRQTQHIRMAPLRKLTWTLRLNDCDGCHFFAQYRRQDQGYTQNTYRRSNLPFEPRMCYSVRPKDLVADPSPLMLLFLVSDLREDVLKNMNGRMTGQPAGSNNRQEVQSSW